MSKVIGIGIICEDLTDYEAVKELVSRIADRTNLRFRPKTGHGSGKIKNKCLSWSNELQVKGCNMLILIHDLDTNDLDELKTLLKQKMKYSTISNRYVCIPIKELEAWFLADPNGIKQSYGIAGLIKIDGMPENINNPKEMLRDKIYTASGRRIEFVTKHNSKIAKCISLDTVKNKCPTFKEFFDYVYAQTFA